MKVLSKLRLDKLGICVSTLCAIHCLITPLILMLLPFAGLAFLEAEGFEISILAFSLFLAISSFAVSYFKKHRNAMPMILGGIGFNLFILGKVVSMEEAEIILSILGGIFVTWAHFKNMKLSK